MNGKIKILFFLFFNTICFSQTFTINGNLTCDNKPIEEAVVLIKNSQNQVVAYNHVNEKGEFVFKLKETGSFYIVVNLLEFEDYEEKIEITTTKTLYHIPISIKKKENQIEEIVIKTTKPIVVKNDTISINANSFLKGNESVVEDLLKKIPGVKVDKNGKIYAEGKEVEMVMVDGDDFFEKQYSILTKSMPVNTVDKVEIIKNFTKNNLAKGFTNTDKVALNLKIKDSKKNILFGTTDLGCGFFSNDIYNLSTNLMVFNKKIKNYSLLHANNIGINNTGNLENYNVVLEEDFETEKNTSFYNSKKTDISEFYTVIEEGKNNFNNLKLASTSSIFNVSDKTKATLSSINFIDKKIFNKNEIQEFNFNDESFTNTNELKQTEKLFSSRFKLKTETLLNKNKKIDFFIDGVYFKNALNKENWFNQVNYLESTTSDNLNINTNLKYSSRKAKSLKIYNFYFHYTNIPEIYQSSNNPTNTLFNNLDGNLNQKIVSKNNSIQLDFLEVFKINEKNKIEYTLSGSYDYFRFQSTLKSLETTLSNNFQNNFTQDNFNIYYSLNYSYNYKKIRTNFMNTVQYFVFNILENNKKDSNVLYNSKFKFSYRLNKWNEFSTQIKYQTIPINSGTYSNNYYLSSSRSFTKGFDTFETTNNLQGLIRYKLGNYNDDFFINTSLVLSKDYSYITTNNLVSENYILSQSIQLKNKNNLIFNSFINYYDNTLGTNFKISYVYQNSKYNNIVNDKNRQIEMKFNTLELETSSPFNHFRFILNGKLNLSQFNSEIKSFNKTLNYSANLEFYKNKINGNLKFENYFFPELDFKRNYSFLDLTLKYIIKENKFTVSLEGRNLLNNKIYSNISITDYSKFVSETPLLKRYLLISLNYSF